LGENDSKIEGANASTISQAHDNDQVLLSEETVNYVLHFANALMGNHDPYQSVMNPMMLNSRLKDITLNPTQASESSLAQALKNPKESELQLQAFSQDFEIQSSVYKKLLSYLGTMLAFDLTYTCKNATAKDYKTKKYNDDLDIVKEFVDKFDYKYEFGTAVQEMLRNEAFFCTPRLQGERYVLQELPSSVAYTMITGRWNYGILFSMNLYWFMQPGVSLDMYDPFFAEKYHELWGSKSTVQQYQPALPPLDRGDSMYVFWQDIPVNVGWCFKMTPAQATRLPFYTSLFSDLIMQPTIRALQKNINMATAARMLVGEVPMLNKSTQAGVKDQFSLSAQNLGNFLSVVRSAISESVKVAAMPLQNIKSVEFPEATGVYSSYLQTMLASSGVNTNLIFTSTQKTNAIESQLSLNVDQNQISSMIYSPMEKFLEYQINRRTSKFKFNFGFQGFNFFNDRQQRFEKAMTLANMGIFLPQQIGASMGMNVFNLERELTEAKEMGWSDKLIPIISAFQQSPSSDGGRPKKSESSLSESGEQTRSDGGNIEKGGKI